MSRIGSVVGREIFNSAGFPTLEVTVVLENGLKASSSVSQSHSKGTFEQKDVYDNDQSRYQGKGMLKSITAVESIIQPKLKDNSGSFGIPNSRIKKPEANKIGQGTSLYRGLF